MLSVFLYYMGKEDPPLWAALLVFPIIWILRIPGMVVGFIGAVVGIALVDAFYLYVLGRPPSEDAEYYGAWAGAAALAALYVAIRYSRRVPAEEYTFKPDY